MSLPGVSAKPDSVPATPMAARCAWSSGGSPGRRAVPGRTTCLRWRTCSASRSRTLALTRPSKTRLLKNIELEMNDSQSVALDLSEYYSMGDWRLMFLLRDRIQAVTEADVLR